MKRFDFLMMDRYIIRECLIFHHHILDFMCIFKNISSIILEDTYKSIVYFSISISDYWVLRPAYASLYPPGRRCYKTRRSSLRVYY